MKRSMFLMALCLAFTLGGCTIGTDGGIWEDWQAVRDKLANKEWSRIYHNEGRLGHPASDVQEIWVFEESGRGTRRSIVTYEDGREKESLEAFS